MLKMQRQVYRRPRMFPNIFVGTSGQCGGNIRLQLPFGICRACSNAINGRMFMSRKNRLTQRNQQFSTQKTDSLKLLFVLRRSQSVPQFPRGAINALQSRRFEFDGGMRLHDFDYRGEDTRNIFATRTIRAQPFRPVQ